MSNGKRPTEIGRDAAGPETDLTVDAKGAVNRRTYLKTAAAGVVGAGALSAPSVARASDVEFRLKLQSNWTGIGIDSQDRSTKLFIDRVNKMSNGRIEITNFDAEVLLGIGETFSGVGLGVADLAITASIYHRGTVGVGEFLWAVPFFPNTNVEFFEQIYQNMGLKEMWREAYAEHGIMHLAQTNSDEWGSMVSTRPVQSFSDFSGMKVRAFGIWAEWMAKQGASVVTVPGGEVYTAIQTRLIDAAAFGGPDAWAGMKMYEVCDYYINPSPCPYDVTEIIMNMDKWNEMPEDLQEVLLAAARVYNLDFTSLTVAADARGRKILEEGGMQTLMIPDEELREAADWCWEQFTAKSGSMPYIDRMIDIYAQAREMHAGYYGPKQLPV
ncbi:MAG: TRAP transporter substrate-binding protein DctP [Pseudomonadota bacterium]